MFYESVSKSHTLNLFGLKLGALYIVLSGLGFGCALLCCAWSITPLSLGTQVLLFQVFALMLAHHAKHPILREQLSLRFLARVALDL